MVVLYGTAARVRQVGKVLQALEVELAPTSERPSPDAHALAVILVTPLPGAENVSRLVTELPQDGSPPIFVVATHDTGDRAVRKAYAAGATAVFHWPREALLLPRLVAELLGVSLVRGRASGPRNALSRTLAAHLRLVPWHTAGVRATARNEGEVHLSGRITTYWRKRELQRLLARIPGVTRIVSTDLLVEPAARTDRQIARDVRSTLRTTVAVDDATLSVAVSGGVVALAGTVADRRELSRILEIVSNVAGVRELMNNLVVSSKAKRKDGTTARRLNDALAKWFPRERIRATVFARIAVLSGKVPSLSRRLEAERFVSHDPTIERVINKLDVS